MAAKDVIKKIRLSLGLTQAELAKELNMYYTQISAYENGKRKPSMKGIRKIVDYAKEHGIEINYIDLSDDDK